MKAFLQALYRMGLWNEEKYHRIKLFSDTPCIRFPRLKFTLFTGEGSVDLSPAEIRELLASIKTACERLDMVHVKIGDISWTTDARLREKNPDRVAIRCWAPSGGLNLGGVSRQRLLSACEEFSDLARQMAAEWRTVVDADS